MTALMTSGYALGGILAAVLGKQLIGEYGWQVVFIAAGVPVLLIPFILKLVPESMTYLISRSRNGELAEVARNLQPGVKHPADAQFVVPTAAWRVRRSPGCSRTGEARARCCSGSPSSRACSWSMRSAAG